MSDLILTCHEFIVPMTQTGEPSILSSTPTILPTTTILENLSRKKLRTCAVDEGEDSCVPNELGAASPVSAVTTILPDFPLHCAEDLSSEIDVCEARAALATAIFQARVAQYRLHAIQAKIRQRQGQRCQRRRRNHPTDHHMSSDMASDDQSSSGPEASLSAGVLSTSKAKRAVGLSPQLRGNGGIRGEGMHVKAICWEGKGEGEGKSTFSVVSERC